MTPNTITILFKEAQDAFSPFDRKPTDDNLLSIRETLLPILMEIPYNQLRGVHSLTAILMDPVRYATNHSGHASKSPVHLPLYNGTIAGNATTVDYASYEAAECGVAKFLREVVDEVWYNDLKDANIFYTKVTALEIIAYLNANSGGLHAIQMISLHPNMHQYYTQVDGIPQYIIMLEDVPKKANWVCMPIADIKLVMMALAAVLSSQHFPHKVDDWEGLSSAARTWTVWKTAFHLTHLKCQCQILAPGGREPLGGAQGVLPAPSPAINRLETALNNLFLVASNNTAILQKLTAANLALTTTITTLTATNKRLADSAARAKGGKPLTATPTTPLGGGDVPQRIRFLTTTAGRMGIDAASNTQVPPVATKPWAIVMRPQLQTPWVAAKGARAGIPVLDREGGLT
jgi:hypothetical protein